MNKGGKLKGTNEIKREGTEKERKKCVVYVKKFHLALSDILVLMKQE